MDDLETDIILEQREAKKLVKEILKEDARARNSDLWLCLQIWIKKQNIKLLIPQNQIKDMITPETITRCRREIQNNPDNPQFLPTDPQVMIRRQFKESVLKRFYANNQTILNEYFNLKYGIA